MQYREHEHTMEEESATLTMEVERREEPTEIGEERAGEASVAKGGRQAHAGELASCGDTTHGTSTRPHYAHSRTCICMHALVNNIP